MDKRTQISNCFDMPLHMTNDEAVIALIDEDAAKLAEIRAKRATIRATRDSYLTAYDASTTATEKKALVGIVRLNQPYSKIEHELETAKLEGKA